MDKFKKQPVIFNISTKYVNGEYIIPNHTLNEDYKHRKRHQCIHSSFYIDKVNEFISGLLCYLTDLPN